jgi:hypothetical protein
MATSADAMRLSMCYESCASAASNLERRVYCNRGSAQIDRYVLTPRSVCVNAVDKGVTARIGVNAVNKGVTSGFAVRGLNVGGADSTRRGNADGVKNKGVLGKGIRTIMKTKGVRSM